MWSSTWLHRYSSLLQWSVPLGQRGRVAMVLCVLCTKCMMHSNHRLTRVIFQHTKRLLPRSGHFSLHTLASPSGRNVNYDEKQLTRKKCLSCSFYLYRFRKYVYYGFPIINFCNPRVHYEAPSIDFLPSARAQIKPRSPCVEVPRSQTIRHTHPVGRLWMSNQVVAEPTS